MLGVRLASFADVPAEFHAALVENGEHLADVAEIRGDVVFELGAGDLTRAWNLWVAAEALDDGRHDVGGCRDEQLA